MMKMKKTEAYFKLLSLLLLTACQTAEPPSPDQPASSEATETTVAADDTGPAIAPRGWTPPPPTQIPPDPSDTLAWTDYYASRIGFQKTFFMQSCGDEGMEPFEVKRLVYSDTAFDLNNIDERLEGKLMFGWEPINYDIDLDWVDRNVTGVQWFEVSANNDPTTGKSNGEAKRIDLNALLEVEAWTFTDTGARDAKEIFFTDINFDGYLDLKMVEAIGKLAWYIYFPWDPAARTFVMDSSLAGISNYLFYDCKNGLLHDYLGGTGGGTSWHSYAFNPYNHTFDPKVYYTAYVKNTNPGSEAEFYWEQEYSKIVVPAHKPGERPPVMPKPESMTLLRRDSLDYE